MAEVLIRDVPDAVIDRLRVKAQRHGRSLEDEVREILKGAATEVNREDFHELAARMRQRYAGRPQADTLELLREDRDR